MKKTLKKLGALLVAVVMTVAMVVPASANTNVPKKGDTATVAVTNVESNATVKGYKIIEANYGPNDEGLLSYSVVKAVTDANLSIAKITDPAAEEITDIATAINNGSLKLAAVDFTYDTNKKDFEYTSASAGTYLVIITSSAEAGAKIYNPLIVSAGYGTDSILANGTVNAGADFQNLAGDTAYAKSSDVSIKKEIVKDSGNVSTDDSAIGDIVNFKITSVVPDYSNEYDQNSLIFTVTDTLDNGLDYVEGSVKLNDNEIKAEDATVSSTQHGLIIVFKSSYIAANGGNSIAITYSAKLNVNATTNTVPNSNTAKLTYTNNPGTTKDATESKTKTYTFEIGALVNGSDTERYKDIVKTDAGTTESGSTTTTYKNLSGATFGLYKDATCATLLNGTSVSDGNGAVNFKGLDGNTVYYLKEITAPNGYSLNTDVVCVKVVPVYDPATGDLSSYSIQYGANEASLRTATNYTVSTTGGSTEVTRDNTNIGYQFKDTKLSNLPSTGGIGTYVFTITGIVIMAVAVALFFMKRKNAAK